MLETTMTVETHIALQAKPRCVIIENIWELAKATGVDIRTLGNSLSLPGNISNDLKNNPNS